MVTSKLPPETQQLWDRLRLEPLLAGFVLVGGTALTLRIGHRVSEDLDFACLDNLLPVRRLTLLRQRLQAEGIALESNQNIAAEQDFIDAGLLLEEHQQNHVASLPDGKVKLSFVRFDNPTTSLLAGDAYTPLRVATLDEVFKLKSLVCAERSCTRDWFDIYVLMTRHGYAASDLHQAFVDADRIGSFDIASMRLRSCTPSLGDPGYTHLMHEAPTLDQIRDFFVEALDKLEVDLSAAAFKAAMPLWEAQMAAADEHARQAHPVNIRQQNAARRAEALRLGVPVAEYDRLRQQQLEHDRTPGTAHDRGKAASQGRG